ncbi:MAG: DUF2283 domain-containing protein [Hydrogenobaculum sp.]
MAKTLLSREDIEIAYKISKLLIKLPNKKLLIDYDEEADVLYINFNNKEKATDSQLIDDNVILRYKDDRLIGITLLNASKDKS